MRIGQGVRTGLGHGGITCVLETQFSSFRFALPLCSWLVMMKTQNSYFAEKASI